uniref:ATP synthase F0 subunit 8 n=1 Tax=Prionospio sp. 6 MH-2023 TaxID=3059274 RepID=A0AAU6QGT8_9ANNE
MPHLAPLAWALAPLTFWAILLTFSASLWWSTTPSFPKFSSASTHKFSNWKWN